MEKLTLILNVSIPILGLVDGDPYGLDILSVYKYGSQSMQHESEKLAARRLKWLGLWASELARYLSLSQRHAPFDTLKV
jgi:DNA topoisomerase VI subunit A